MTDPTRVPSREECLKAVPRLADVLLRAKRNRGVSGYYDAIGYWTEMIIERLAGNTAASFKAYEVLNDAQKLMSAREVKAEQAKKSRHDDDDWSWPDNKWGWPTNK